MQYSKLFGFLFCILAFSANCHAYNDLEKTEKKYGVKIGAFAIDTNSGRIFAHRQDEQFPLQSTVKIMISAAALKHTDAAEKVKKHQS